MTPADGDELPADGGQGTGSGTPTTTHRTWWSWAMVVVAGTGGLGVAAASVVGWLGAWRWQLDLLSHFRVQYVVLGTVALVGLALLRSWWPAGVVAVVLVVDLVAVAPLVLGGAGRGSSAVDAVDLRVVQANVLTSNSRRAQTGAWLASQDADVLVVQEVDRAWVEVLDQELAAWERLPTDSIRADNFGMAVWVRADLSVSDVAIIDTAADVPAISAVLDVGGDPVLLYALHTLPPLDARAADRSAAQLRDAGAAVAGHEGPALLVGDLNATRWSATLRGLLGSSRLRDSARGTGVMGSWPASLGFTGRIGIDHVLVTEEVEVVERRLGPSDLGSDHLPVVVDLTVGDT